ncbi:MAG TPA: chemotaxis protein CheX [Thermoanaerobaculia bacterium]|nr:chemotaxis protein CheX [Thermoanaerobaculia bacterium]
MNPEQLRLFKRITLDYFAKLAPEDTPELAEPHMHFGDPELLDYTSLIEIRGQYDGCIYLTSPAAMLRDVLTINGESKDSPEHLKDMCQEFSNVLSGNASKAFGGNWQISVPHSLTMSEVRALTLPESTFVMPIHWRGERSLLVVALREKEEAA